jgi:hypothetical protein
MINGRCRKIGSIVYQGNQSRLTVDPFCPEKFVDIFDYQMKDLLVITVGNGRHILQIAYLTADHPSS